MEILISEAVAKKLREKHFVFEDEVIECFENQVKDAIADTREAHATYPPTLWFIAETNAGRRLKVVFIQIAKTKVVVRTAYQPDEIEEEIYEREA